MRFRQRRPSTFCTFRPENVSSLSDSESNSLGGDPNLIDKKSDANGIDGENLNLTGNSSSALDGFDAAESSKIELQNGAGELTLEGNEVGVNKPVEDGGKKEFGIARLPLVVFLVGLWTKARDLIRKAFSDFLIWWPFWRQEKHLAHLIAEADANPQDAIKQSALLVELNKHRLGQTLL